MESFLKEQLEKTVYVHFPLEAEIGKGMEQKLLEKKIEKETALWDGEEEACFESSGRGQYEIRDKSIEIRTNSREEYWPETENQKGIYSTFGDYTVYLDVSELDLAAYNQIYFEIKAECEGMHSPMIWVGFENDGVRKIPDQYSRGGWHDAADVSQQTIQTAEIVHALLECAAAVRYGSYLKKLMEYASAYGMIPAGIYCVDELKDAEAFDLVHPRLDFAKEKDNYRQQLESGIRLNDRYCIRQFPVWFSYRGNNAILLSMAKSASLLGKCLGDTELVEIAREQMYWIVGKNPFENSFIYGEGRGFGKQYNALAGEMVGEIPVGTQTQVIGCGLRPICTADKTEIIL